MLAPSSMTTPRPLVHELAEQARTHASDGRDHIYRGTAFTTPFAERVTSATRDAQLGLAVLEQLSGHPDLPAGVDLATPRTSLEMALAALTQLASRTTDPQAEPFVSDPASVADQRAVYVAADSFIDAAESIGASFELSRQGWLS